MNPGTPVALDKAYGLIYKNLGDNVDTYLQEGKLALGRDIQLKLDIFHSPGHSLGHVTIYWPDERAS